MNKYWFYKVGLVVVFLCFALLGGAKVKLPTLVSDGMVLQRGEPVNIWGTADPDETVDITFLKKKYKTVADVQGNWKVTLPILKAGGPYTMAINDIELKDILIGDVWVCSGQSNMELPVSRVTDRFRDEISTDSNYPMVRYIKTPLLYNFHAPQADIPGISWQAMTPENVMPFCLRRYKLSDDKGTVFFECVGNYHTINEIKLDAPIITNLIKLEVERPMQNVPAAIFQINIE